MLFRDHARAPSSPRGRSVGTHVGETSLDLGDSVRLLRGFGFLEEARTLAVGGQHRVKQTLRPIRRFLAPWIERERAWTLGAVLLLAGVTKGS